MDESPDDLLSISEAAAIVRMSVQTIRRWERTGHLPAVRTPGGQRRFRRSDVLAALVPSEPKAAS